MTATKPDPTTSTANVTAKADPIPHPALDASVEPTTRRERGLDKVVFGVTAAIAVGFLVWGFLSTGSLATVSGDALTWTMGSMGWLFVLTASAFVVFVLWLALGRFGAIPLGRDDEEPEFRTVSWVAMMFSAGMGIGLMFYGVSEPITHFATPPAGHGSRGQPRGRPERDGDDALPLDAAPLGDLRRRGARHRLRRLPQGPPPADQLPPSSRSWASAPTARPARSSTCSPSSRRCSARPPRSAWAPCRSAAAWRSWPASARSATPS